MKIFYDKIKVMKNCRLVFFLIFCLAFFSCSNEQVLKVNLTEQDTLKTFLEDKENETNWNEEIEGSRLSQKIVPDASLISSEVSMTVQTASVTKNYNAELYPWLENFGSLDTTALSKADLKFVNDFITSLSENFYNGPETFFKSEYQFNYEFFKNDFLALWKSKFNEDFNDENSSEKFFTDWVLGEPSFSENEVIIPVRLYKNNKTADLKIFQEINPLANGIYKIEIIKMGEN